VMTGFRVALGGAQAHYQVKPDLTTLGKVIGGGLPVAAFGGKREINRVTTNAIKCPYRGINAARNVVLCCIKKR